MGLFSSKKVTHVSSVVYNMAGDEPDRPDYLKSLLVQHMASSSRTKGDITQTITNAYLRGPLQDRRGFLRWCEAHHPSYLMSGTLQGSKELPRLTVNLLSYITKQDPTARVQLDSYSIERADFFYWAENFIAQTYPAHIGGNWTCDILGNNSTVIVTLPDTTTDSFTILGYDPSATYLFVRYHEAVYGPLGQVVSRTPYVWPYELGSNEYPKLDALLRRATAEPEFFPVIPLRKDNVSVADTPYFEDVSEIYKKLAGRKKLDALLTSIEDNENIDDVDFAAVVFGVCVNDKTRAGKRYLYNFFRKLMSHQDNTVADFIRWKARAETATANQEHIRDPAISSFEIKGLGGHNGNYKFVLSWVSIDETFHTGLGKPGAEKHDIWFEEGDDLTYTVGSHDDRTIETSVIKMVEMFWQTGANRYKKLRLYGMLHQNYVYNNKAVKSELWEGVSDSEDSEFFVPLHNPTLERLSVTDATQLCTTSTLLVFNCYSIQRVRWYQRGFFKILFIVVSIAVAVFLNPAALGAATGVLGTNFAVGSALGLSGLVATIVGAAANAIAGMVLASMIQEISTEIFGDEFGALFGTILSFVVGNLATNFAATGSFTMAWDTLMLPENLLKLAEVGSNALSQWAQGSITAINDKMLGLTEDYEDKSNEISERYEEVLGYSGVVLDPLSFSQGLDRSNTLQFSESSNAFLQRTLLVGPEIVEISHTLIADFPQLSLKLPGAFS